MLDSARALRTQIYGRQSVSFAPDLQSSSDPLFALGATARALPRRRDAVEIFRVFRPAPARSWRRSNCETNAIDQFADVASSFLRTCRMSRNGMLDIRGLTIA